MISVLPTGHHRRSFELPVIRGVSVPGPYLPIRQSILLGTGVVVDVDSGPNAIGECIVQVFPWEPMRRHRVLLPRSSRFPRSGVSVSVLPRVDSPVSYLERGGSYKFRRRSYHDQPGSTSSRGHEAHKVVVVGEGKEYSVE